MDNTSIATDMNLPVYVRRCKYTVASLQPPDPPKCHHCQNKGITMSDVEKCNVDDCEAKNHHYCMPRHLIFDHLMPQMKKMQQEIQDLRETILYIPGQPGALAAEAHFYELATTNSGTKTRQESSGH